MGEARIIASAKAQKESHRPSPGARRHSILESRSARLASAGLVFVLSLALYTATLAPTVTLIDSGELIAAAEEPGVAHPPGFPLYTLLAHLATLVPLGSMAERVNFASALFASLAAAVLTLTVHEAMIARSLLRQAARKREKKRDRKGKPQKSDSYETFDQDSHAWLNALLPLLPGTIAGLLVAGSRTLWSYATIAEVYTLNTLLIFVVFYLMLRWRRERLQSKQNDRAFYTAAFIFGLALGVHHVTVGLMLPALAALAFSIEGWQFFKSRRLLYAALLSLAGLSIYMYLPIAAASSPLVNWGDPRTFERFWWHVTGRQYQDFLSFSLERVFNQFGQFITFIGREFGPWWLPLTLFVAAAGFYAIFRRDRPLFWFLALVVLFDLAYALNYEIAEDKDAYYLPAFLAMAVGAGAGAEWLIARASTLRVHRAATAALLLALPAISIASSLPFNDRSRYFIAEDYVENILSTIEPRGMLLTLDWQVYSPMMYFRIIEKRRPDVTVIDVNHLRRSWYYGYLRRAYPELIEKNRERVEAFLEDLNNWEHNPDLYQRDLSLNQRINVRFYDMIRSFIASHADAAPVYMTQELATNTEHRDAELTRSLASLYQFVPQGLVFELAKGREYREPAEPELKMSGLFDGSLRFEKDDVVRIKVIPVYISMLANRGLYLAANNRHDRAIEYFNQSLALDPDYTPARQALNESLKAMRNAQPAKWQ
ncbi:MAG TPA: DUF2723 domain-containing protein [Blastocatellia bacterium]|nr:DUF2723 domain-containing protein [Blastocatellia bacterium]